MILTKNWGHPPSEASKMGGGGHVPPGHPHGQPMYSILAYCTVKHGFRIKVSSKFYCLIRL